MTDGQLTEVTGLWWLPEDPDSTIGGTLKIDKQRRIELRLIGAFRDSSGSAREDLQVPIILGAGEGKLVTLAHCMETSSNIAFPGIRSSGFQVDTALIGAHVTAPESIRFDVLYARPEHIEAWLRTPGPQSDLQMIENRLQAATLTYVRPDSIELQLDGGLLSVVFGCTIDGPRLERRLASRAGLELKPRDPISLDLFHSEYLVPALNLVALAAGRGIGLRELQGKLAAQSVVEGNREVRVIPRGFPWAETEESDEATMLFTARDLGDDLPQRVQQWYRRSAELGSVFNLYFATLFGADMYGEHRFLTLAQAVESYHRLTSEGLILAKPAYKQLRRRLRLSIDIAGVPEGAAKVMKDKLAYLNEISLRERIRSLLSSRSDQIKGLIPDIEGFATVVADTRNYLTHFSRRLKTKAATGPDLIRISEQLRYVVELLVLTELGLTEAQRAAIVRKRERELSELTFLRA